MNNNTVKKIMINIMKQNIKSTILLILCIIGVVTTSLIPPQILKQIIDKNLMAKTSEGLLTLGFVYIGVLIFIGVFDFSKELILTILGQKLSKELRVKLMEKTQRLNATFFILNDSGDTVSRFINDVDAVNSMFTSGIIGMIIDCFKIVGIIISIWIFAKNLALFILLIIPIVYFITRSFQKNMLKAQIQNRILVGKVNNHIAESLKNMLMIKSRSKEQYMEQKYTSYLRDNYRTVEKVNFYDSIFSPVIFIIRACVISMLVIMSSGQLNYFGLSVGMVVAVIELISNIFAPIESLGTELQNVQQAVSGIKRLNELYDEPEEQQKNSNLILGDIINNANISFKDLSFYYEQDTYILKNITLDIKPKEQVTFTGRTGVGKSTLFRLIMGLLTPTSGAIEINGINVCHIPNSEKRKIFGYVEQSFHLIKGTVAEQISLKDETITKKQIAGVIDFVGLAEYVATLDNGIDTEITSGSVFSQGQKQLLAIARAIVTNPPILLLDEITANLDSITEERIIKLLQKASGRFTMLSVSHRLSSITASDTVVILEHGRIKNIGSPDTVMQNDDWYRSHIEIEKLLQNTKN